MTMVLVRKKQPECREDLLLAGRRCRQSRSEQRQGSYVKEWSKLDLWKQLSTPLSLHQAGSQVTQREGGGHGTWQALAENFGLRSPRFRAGPARALVLGCLVNLKTTSQSISWLLGRESQSLPRSPPEPRLGRLGEAGTEGGSL